MSASEPLPDLHFRSASGLVYGYLTIGLVVVVLGLTLADGVPPAWMIAGATLALAAAWAVLLRPRVRVLDRTTLVLRTPLTEVSVPLAAVDDLVVRQWLVVRVGERRFTCAAVGRTARQLRRDGRRSSSHPSPTASALPTHDGLVADRLASLVESARAQLGVRGDGRQAPEVETRLDAARAEVRRTPAWPEIAVLSGSALAFALAVLVR